MSFQWRTYTFETPWEALVGAWAEISDINNLQISTVRSLATDCDAATRHISQEDANDSLPRIYDVGTHAEEQEVPFDPDDHITALMEAAERALHELGEA
ncbi:hypothetical protein HH1059_19810 [Halorhodospira halochloris]|uniref:Uncharacterized protein n=1 Tax=Halorhodospira halochloris TaxID=1052 RepID=A0A0X8XAX7_HALHR|nr:hypothetical protein [Halorhodospira halochloris]MBK1652725.1 hypothetical protein [Halorhodospira halochloris]BAU58686.1 hypothetical protein HH1059_19810 [Halorhodospira halochloris]